MNGPRAIGRLLVSYARVNAQMALEYRASLISQAAAMLINNVMWVVFMASYFDRFSLPGWTRADVITLWAVLSASVGMAEMFFGNATRLAGIITRGELDFFLALPKPVLLHLLVSRMKLVAPGDVAFGLLAFGLYGHPSAGGWALFGVCTLTGAAIMVSYAVLVGSLAFWLGRAESAASQLYNALITLSTYPAPIFKGAARVILHTAVPAALVSTLPAELIRQPRPLIAGELLACAAVWVLLAVSVFRAGLARYTSGNLVTVRE